VREKEAFSAIFEEMDIVREKTDGKKYRKILGFSRLPEFCLVFSERKSLCAHAIKLS